MFCLCMCALLKFIKVFCIVLYILMALLHCYLERPRAASDLRHDGSVHRRNGQIIVGVDDDDNDSSKMPSLRLQIRKKGGLGIFIFLY